MKKCSEAFAFHKSSLRPSLYSCRCTSSVPSSPSSRDQSSPSHHSRIVATTLEKYAQWKVVSPADQAKTNTFLSSKAIRTASHLLTQALHDPKSLIDDHQWSRLLPQINTASTSTHCGSSSQSKGSTHSLPSSRVGNNFASLLEKCHLCNADAKDDSDSNSEVEYEHAELWFLLSQFPLVVDTLSTAVAEDPFYSHQVYCAMQSLVRLLFTRVTALREREAIFLKAIEADDRAIKEGVRNALLRASVYETDSRASQQTPSSSTSSSSSPSQPPHVPVNIRKTRRRIPLDHLSPSSSSTSLRLSSYGDDDLLNAINESRAPSAPPSSSPPLPSPSITRQDDTIPSDILARINAIRTHSLSTMARALAAEHSEVRSLLFFATYAFISHLT